jgi:hypothetical protein
MGNGICFENDAELAEFKRRIAGQNVPVERLLQITGCKGTREQCIEFLHKWKKKGCDASSSSFRTSRRSAMAARRRRSSERDILPHV